MQTMEMEIEHSNTLSSVRVTMISDIDFVWSHIIPLLNEAFIYGDGELTTNDVYINLKRGNMQLWCAFDNSGILAMLITEVINYPQKKVVRSVALAGRNLDKWFDMGLSMIENWAKSVGAKGIELSGRKGWGKLLSKHGYKERYVTLKKEVV